MSNVAMDGPREYPRIEQIDGMRVYEPDGAVLGRYLADRSHVSIIRGPIGSGTSSCSCMKIYAIGMEQWPSPVDGKRRTRWGIVRNTYPELRDTTLKTWLDWFPEEQYGRLIRSRPMCHEIRLGDLEMDVYFFALDDESDLAKMRSLEMTGWWFNELEFIPKSIVDEAESRTGRYPAAKDGGARWDGVIGDMNAPSEDHWVPRMMGEAEYPDDVPEDQRVFKPANWAYFVQPPALEEVLASDGKSVVGYRTNPAAENMKWLKPGYYEEKAAGKSKKWIDSRLRNKISFIVEGDPVWPNVNPELHFSPVELEPVPGHTVYVSLDFGRRPTALFSQEINGRIYCQYELRMYGVGASIFAPKVREFLTRNYPGFHVEFTGDPKGRDRGQASETTAYDVFAGLGMPVRPAPMRGHVNNIEERITAVEHVLNDMAMGYPRLLVSPRCSSLRGALEGRYRLHKLELGDSQPIKDKWSDIADCLQYLVLYLGAGKRMVGLEASGVASGRFSVAGKRKDRRRGRAA